MKKAKEFLVDYRKADHRRLQFERRNLYDLESEARMFDEIICYETLEHVCRDSDVVREMYRILRPGGVLHLCCPYRLHPRHQAEILDVSETGGHVRAGYTEEDFRRLLEPVGFQIELFVGIGPTAVYLADRVLRALRNRLGDRAVLPLLPLSLMIVGAARTNPPMPFSLYAKAVKALPQS